MILFREGVYELVVVNYHYAVRNTSTEVEEYTGDKLYEAYDVLINSLEAESTLAYAKATGAKLIVKVGAMDSNDSPEFDKGY